MLLVLRMMHDDRLAKSFLASIGESSSPSSADGSSFGQQLAQLHVDAPDLGAAAQRSIMTGVIYLASAHPDPRIGISVANESAINPDGILAKLGFALKSLFKNPDNGSPTALAGA